LRASRHFTDVLKWLCCPLDPEIERALLFCRDENLLFCRDENMAGKKSAEPSPESIARAERQRLALEEGARAMADIERDAIAVRTNMERLRALRQAKEAGEARADAMAPAASKISRTKRASK
jgi:hypothetical protein